MKIYKLVTNGKDAKWYSWYSPIGKWIPLKDNVLRITPSQFTVLYTGRSHDGKERVDIYAQKPKEMLEFPVIDQ